MSTSFPRLIYRGHYEVVCNIDFTESILSATYPGGYEETTVVGSENGRRSWSLKYPNNNKRAMIYPKDAEPVSRDQYIWDFVCTSISGGRIPFIMQCPRDGKDYLCLFKDNNLSYTLVDQFCRSTGLQIIQVAVKGVATLADGSLGEPVSPDET
jgi:hypothetical protein